MERLIKALPIETCIANRTIVMRSNLNATSAAALPSIASSAKPCLDVSRATPRDSFVLLYINTKKIATIQKKPTTTLEAKFRTSRQFFFPIARGPGINKYINK